MKDSFSEAEAGHRRTAAGGEVACAPEGAEGPAEANKLCRPKAEGSRADWGRAVERAAGSSAEGALEKSRQNSTGIFFSRATRCERRAPECTFQDHRNAQPKHFHPGAQPRQQAQTSLALRVVSTD